MSARFFFWPVVGLRRVNVLTEDGELAEASWVLYRRGHAGVAALWVHSDLAAVNPELETDAPEWIDLSLVTVVKGPLVLRRHPEAPCRWARWIHSEVMNGDTPANRYPYPRDAGHGSGRIGSRVVAGGNRSARRIREVASSIFVYARLLVQ